MEKPMTHERSETLAFEGQPELGLWRSEAFPEDLDSDGDGAASEGCDDSDGWRQPLLMLVPLGTALIGLAAWVPVIVQ